MAGFFLRRRKSRPPPTAATPAPPAIPAISVAERPGVLGANSVKGTGFVKVLSGSIIVLPLVMSFSPLAGGICAVRLPAPALNKVVSQVRMNVWLWPWASVKFCTATDPAVPQDRVSWKFSSVVPLL